MIVRRNLKFSLLIRHLYLPVLYFLVVATVVYVAYDVLDISQFRLPAALTAVMGTALAIFIGFRNSSSYDRWWEARKIWGGVVNYSRTFGRQATTLVTLQHVRGASTPGELAYIHRDLVRRHLAWINALRIQLRGQQDWTDVERHLSAEEWAVLKDKKNKATQLVQQQAEVITKLQMQGFVEDFRHIQLDNTLTELYNLQGKAERIKNTPLPRQYDYFINMFLWCFVTLLPATLIQPLSEIQISISVIPLSALISLCFYVVAAVAAYNEDPFENKPSDTPMTALCRTIEIDLLEQLKEKNLPEKLTPVDGFLM